MPTYILKTSNLKLNIKKKNKIAKEITKEHNKITGANSYFVQVIFEENIKKNHFMGGKIVNDKSKIVIDNLNISKRPISAVADNLEVRNAKTIIIQINKSIKFNLLYDKNRSLQKKIKIEQLKRETS